jgi:hypothetical protein
MVGKYDIEIYNNRVHYFLTLKRNITILQGNSATGKTELIRLIEEFEENGVSSGITIVCDVKCTVLTPVDWELRLSSLKNRIIFIDETAGFIKSKRFAEMVKGCDNYFVIVTRDDLSQLPYSVDEIYGLKNDTSKYKQFKKVYNEMYSLYNLLPVEKVMPEVVITEDTNSGFECFDHIYSGKCISAGGKSKVYSLIRANRDEDILAIVDGAAFGSEIGKIIRYLRVSGIRCTLYAPESFEYLILRSGLVDVPTEIIEETFRYADSVEYMSWEEFYTAYLIKAAGDTIYRYSKSRLNDAYATKGSIRRIIEILPEQIRPEGE